MPVLSWSGCRNVRDLGGLPTVDGRTTRARVLVRADTLSCLDGDGLAALEAYGVSRIVDLRAVEETVDPPHPWAGRDGYVSVPWIDIDREAERDPEIGRSLADLYRGSLDRNVRQVASAVRAFLTAPEGPVVVHCAAGKDRTGMLVALLLEVAGVSREVVLDDYAVSSEQLGIAALLERMSEQERAAIEEYVWSRPETLRTALAHLDRRYGGPRAYLRDACGLEETEVDALRERLVGD